MQVIQYKEFSTDLILKAMDAGFGTGIIEIMVPKIHGDFHLDTKWGNSVRAYYRMEVGGPEEVPLQFLFVGTGTIFDLPDGFNYLTSLHLYNDTTFVHAYYRKLG